ncbi:UDP-N-acetylglucosamine 4,6-dehydratase family protein [uncultured Tateyamaria sp.]|uniref:UDP-N-acetylglucosamine 4,6-dehydratase family protein n=1 Tax=uncultured Tateyamaria sp. TaxID=455651 RepID=UPI002629F623|nr:UDP-N-acetylglucosamine 4,6-dehydratase family protein [uncultured Tateyamaria sp.]
MSFALTFASVAVLALGGVHIPIDFLIIFGMSLFVCASILCSALSLGTDAHDPKENAWSAGSAHKKPIHLQTPPKLDPVSKMRPDGDSITLDTSGLLGRDEIKTCQGLAAKAYADRVVLISGAGGSIGSELVRQVLACRPRKIVLYELNETALYQIHQSMLLAAAGTNIEIVPLLGSVADEHKVRRTLHAHQVQVVLHAAAYKHVPLVELNPLAGLSNNVLATQTLVTEAVAAGVERFVLISSDKAVRPINVMGASKRLCELIVQDIARRLEGKGGPVFAIVRFGNVLGSSGSVLPLFQDQVRKGGPVTVTHPDVCRFFMTVQEAVNLVLHAGSLARGGEVFVLDMGRPVRIETLARQVIHSAGLSVRDADNPTGDVEIKFIGLRCGEKMREELTLNGRRSPTPHPRIFTAIEDGLSEFEVAAALRALRQALADDDEADARANACRWVQGFGDLADGSARKTSRPFMRQDTKGLLVKTDHSSRVEAGRQ